MPDYYERTLNRDEQAKVTKNVTVRALQEHPDTVAQIMGGNKKAVGAVVAQVMKHTVGQASPQQIHQEIQGYLQALEERDVKCPRCEGPKEVLRIRYKRADGKTRNYWACEDCKTEITDATMEGFA